MLPQVDVVHGFEITFNASDRSSWKKYARALESQLKRECCLKGAFDEVKSFALSSLKYAYTNLPPCMPFFIVATLPNFRETEEGESLLYAKHSHTMLLGPHFCADPLD